MADSDSSTSGCQARLGGCRNSPGWNCGEGRVQRAEMDQNHTTSRRELCMVCDLVHVNGLGIFYSSRVDRAVQTSRPPTDKKQTNKQNQKKKVKVDKWRIGRGKSLERWRVLLNGPAQVVCVFASGRLWKKDRGLLCCGEAPRAAGGSQPVK